MGALFSIAFVITLIVLACLIVGSDDDDHFYGSYRVL